MASGFVPAQGGCWATGSVANTPICAGTYNGEPALCKIAFRHTHMVTASRSGALTEAALYEAGWCRKIKDLCRTGQCPNLVDVFDIYVETLTVAIVMRKYENTLEAILAGGMLPDTLATRKLISGVYAGAAWMHRNDMVHCDIKPANIAVHQGVAILIDVGSFQFIGGPIHTITFNYSLSGLGESAHPSHDFFSIGVVVYRIFGGARLPSKIASRKGDFGLLSVDQEMHQAHPNVPAVQAVSLCAIARQGVPKESAIVPARKARLRPKRQNQATG